MAIICIYCGRDINALGQDNVSLTPGKPECEDCREAELNEFYSNDDFSAMNDDYFEAMIDECE